MSSVGRRFRMADAPPRLPGATVWPVPSRHTRSEKFVANQSMPCPGVTLGRELTINGGRDEPAIGVPGRGVGRCEGLWVDRDQRRLAKTLLSRRSRTPHDATRYPLPDRNVGDVVGREVVGSSQPKTG